MTQNLLEYIQQQIADVDKQLRTAEDELTELYALAMELVADGKDSAEAWRAYGNQAELAGRLAQRMEGLLVALSQLTAN